MPGNSYRSRRTGQSLSRDGNSKWCPACRKFEPLENFSRHAGTATKLNAWCKKKITEKVQRQKKHAQASAKSHGPELFGGPQAQLLSQKVF